MTFVYEDSTAVLGPLSRTSEPHAYDLCREHATRMTAPRGWELLRVPGAEVVSDDLVALADAVRPQQASSEPAPTSSRGTARSSRDTPSRGAAPARHLHVVRSTND
ncbi:MAG: DUF3499 family protein [Brachybacterium sp.]|uniref:DUF3499 family protein n=1 Tax=unclassified Brachybacterium TaxID=2623841 RepID=UPI003F9919E7